MLQDRKSPARPKPIDAEIAPVEREDLANTVSNRGSDKRGVRKVHRQIPVLSHQRSHARQIVPVEGKHLKSASFDHFSENATEARTALAMVQEAPDVLAILLEGGHSVIAGRLAGAFRNVGREKIAERIANDMRKASYMKRVEQVYVTDAYHSLSIEGYRVSAELIERVRAGDWNPDKNEEDRERRNALAARGYYDAFQAVKQSVEKVLEKENAGSVAGNDHAAWYAELFGPSVSAGILRPGDLAGYRNGPVHIRNSLHAPPSREACAT